MREMSSMYRGPGGIRISREIVSNLRAPEIEAQLQVERSLDRLVQAHEAQSPGLVHNLCRELTGTTGEPIAIHISELFARLRPKYPEAEITGVLDQLTTNGMLLSHNGTVRLQGGVLSKLIHANIQAQTAELQKIEAFIANRYDYYLEKGQLLSEQDINYINPSIGNIVLSPEAQEFITGSQAAISKQKRRKSLTIAVVIAALSLLALVAIFFALKSGIKATEARQQSVEATIQAENARQQQAIAEARTIEATRAKHIADSTLTELTKANADLEKAALHIQNLLGVVTTEKDIAVKARDFAEKQQGIAQTRARKIDSLNLVLQDNVARTQLEADRAIAAEKTANREKEISVELRNILLSRIVAQRSLAMKDGDEDLQAYTAMLAYHVNESARTNGDILHPDVFSATYYAAKSLGSAAISPSVSLTGGAIGTIVCSGATCITGASDGTVVQFAIDHGSGALQNKQTIFAYPHDAVHFVFPQKDESGNSGSAFILGAFDHILELSVPAKGEGTAVQLRKIEIPDKQFVKHATRISETDLLIQIADGGVYRFDGTQRRLHQLLDPADGIVACAVLPEQNLMCYATVADELYLDDLESDKLRETRLQYARAKKRVAQMQLRQYENTTYLAVAYLDGEL